MTIVDAGGGTLDISTYAKKPFRKDEFEEIAAAMCRRYLSPETASGFIGISFRFLQGINLCYSCRKAVP